MSQTSQEGGSAIAKSLDFGKFLGETNGLVHIILQRPAHGEVSLFRMEHTNDSSAGAIAIKPAVVKNWFHIDVEKVGIQLFLECLHQVKYNSPQICQPLERLTLFLTQIIHLEIVAIGRNNQAQIVAIQFQRVTVNTFERSSILEICQSLLEPVRTVKRFKLMDDCKISVFEVKHCKKWVTPNPFP